MGNRYDYAGHFRGIRDQERLVLSAPEITWQENYERPTHPVDVLVYLGCHVMITGHLAVELTTVLDNLGVDYVAVGGMQFCCGIVHHSHGDVDAANRISSATVDRMRSYGAKTLVMWCPSCDLQFEDVIVPALADSLGMETVHATQFLAERAADLPFVAPIRRRVAVHTHVGYRRQERDSEACRALLTAIPGVEVVGEVASDLLGYDCVTPEAFRNLSAQRDRLLSEARELGADTLVTLYHSCHRRWCDADSPDLRIRNYISLIADAIGHGADDRYMRLAQASEVGEVVDLSRQQWSSHGLSQSKAENIAQAHFTPIPPTSSNG
jgi:Fe-S oxidoreductase